MMAYGAAKGYMAAAKLESLGRNEEAKNTLLSMIEIHTHKIIH